MIDAFNPGSTRPAITVSRPWLNGKQLDFDLFYTTEVEPHVDDYRRLEEQQAPKLRRIRKLRTVCFVGLIAGIVAVAATQHVDLAALKPYAIVLAAGCVVLLALTQWMIRLEEKGLRAMLQKAVLTPVASVFGLKHSFQKGRHSVIPYDHLLPSYSYANTDDVLEGAMEGRRIEVMDVELVRRRRKRSNITVFRGLLVHVGGMIATPGPIRIIPDENMLERFASSVFGSGDLVEFVEDGRFEQLFSVYARDPESARSLLSQEVRDGLVQTRSIMQASRTAIGIDQAGVRMTFDNGEDFGEIGDVLDIPDFRELSRHMVYEFMTIAKLNVALSPLFGDTTPD